MLQRTFRARAPLRLGLAGGGSDVSPYCDRYGGEVLNVAIDRSAFASVTPREDGRVVLEAGDLGRRDELDLGGDPDLAAGLRLHRGAYGHVLRSGGLAGWRGLTLSTAVDSPVGAGLGSSSALMVAMLAALHGAAGRRLTRAALARLAVEVERRDLGLNGGRQDQYAAAFGGCHLMRFGPGEGVRVRPVALPPGLRRELESSLVLFHTGVSRESARIIDSQSAAVDAGGDALDAMHQLKREASAMEAALRSGRLDAVAEVLRRGWEAKKRTSSAVSNPDIERLHALAMEAGAAAGKASGAGGGGFMMFLVEPTRRAALVQALSRSGAGTASAARFSFAGTETWWADAALADRG